jgi:photosystem II stability/assembly factor-like uncharacterized protein
MILKTTDSGENWVVQISNAAGNLLSISAVNARTACAVGANGIIVRTTDGGATWVRDASGTTVPLRGIFFRNDTDGWAVGRDGVILRFSGAGNGDLRTLLN